jgi:hypothetical protein
VGGGGPCRWGGSGNETDAGLAVDPLSGSIHVAGTFDTSNLTLAGTSLINAGGTDIVLSRVYLVTGGCMQKPAQVGCLGSMPHGCGGTAATA